MSQDDSKVFGLCSGRGKLSCLLLRWSLWKVQVWGSWSGFSFSFEVLKISIIYEVWQCLSQAKSVCLTIPSCVDPGDHLKSLDRWGMVPVPCSRWVFNRGLFENMEEGNREKGWVSSVWAWVNTYNHKVSTLIYSASVLSVQWLVCCDFFFVCEIALSFSSETCWKVLSWALELTSYHFFFCK